MANAAMQESSRVSCTILVMTASPERAEITVPQVPQFGTRFLVPRGEQKKSPPRADGAGGKHLNGGDAQRRITRGRQPRRGAGSARRRLFHSIAERPLAHRVV